MYLYYVECRYVCKNLICFEGRLVAVKRVFLYLVRTSNFGMWIPYGSFRLIGFGLGRVQGGSQFASQPPLLVNFLIKHWCAGVQRSKTVDRRPTSCAWKFLDRSVVSWYSKKQIFSPQLKPSTSPPQIVMLNCYGGDKIFKWSTPLSSQNYTWSYLVDLTVWFAKVLQSRIPT